MSRTQPTTEELFYSWMEYLDKLVAQGTVFFRERNTDNSYSERQIKSLAIKASLCIVASELDVNYYELRKYYLQYLKAKKERVQ